MSNIEEEGLDKIFKQRLKEPGNFAEYRESDWNAFEQMLDERDNKRPVIFWLRVASGIAAVMLLAFGWLYMQQGNVKTVKQPVAINHAKHNGINTQNISGTKPGAVNTQAAAAVTTTEASHHNTGTSGGDEHQIAVGSNNTPSSVNSHYTLAMDRHYRKDKSFFPLSPTAARRDTAGLLNNDNVISGDHTEVLAALSGNKIDAFDVDHVTNLPEIKNDEVNAASDLTHNIKDINKRRPQYALTILAAPNINGVNSFKQAQTGADLGMQFSVSISRFTFTTGAVYAKTPYLTPFEDYHTSYQFKYDPVDVSADCRVLDIPLNIDYRFYSKGNNKFSVGTGLSSYIMLSENYHYNYAKSYGYVPTDYNIVNQNQHFLGVLNLQATYQRRLNTKLSLDVQPYLKIPLTGIGYSRVNLQTAGVAFGLSWNLNSLTKP